MASLKWITCIGLIVLCALHVFFIAVDSPSVRWNAKIGRNLSNSILKKGSNEGYKSVIKGNAISTQFSMIKITVQPTKPQEEFLGWRKKFQWKSKLDEHKYRYLINPEDSCKKVKNITLLILVKTRVDDRKQRDLIRQSYGRGVYKYNVSAIIIFIVGTTKDNNTNKQTELQEEATLYGDILQEDFCDTYYNLTVKLIMGFKWASIYCNNSAFVMSTDDDVIVDIVNLAHDLANGSSEFRLKFALSEPAINWNPIRDIGSKWYTPKSFFAKDRWPPFPRGYAYIVSKDVAFNIYRESQKFAPVAPWDDVYSGFLLQRLGVMMYDIRTWYKNRHQDTPMEPLNKGHHYAIVEFGGHSKEKLWKAIEGRYNNILNVSDSVLG